MSFDRSFIRVKTMLIASNDDLSAHAVSLHGATVEDASGYHRLVGGSVGVGETHRDAIVREVREELGAQVHDLTFLSAEESIFQRDGQLAHNIVFLYTGRLDPMPALMNATLREDDGSLVPVVWRSFDEHDEPLPLYPPEAVPWLRYLRQHGSDPALGAHGTRSGTWDRR
jgi:ADP-ribose pyrophosphatase YjhB (NUDIX family)